MKFRRDKNWERFCLGLIESICTNNDKLNQIYSNIIEYFLKPMIKLENRRAKGAQDIQSLKTFTQELVDKYNAAVHASENGTNFAGRDRINLFTPPTGVVELQPRSRRSIDPTSIWRTYGSSSSTSPISGSTSSSIIVAASGGYASDVEGSMPAPPVVVQEQLDVCKK